MGSWCCLNGLNQPMQTDDKIWLAFTGAKLIIGLTVCILIWIWTASPAIAFLSLGAYWLGVLVKSSLKT